MRLRFERITRAGLRDRARASRRLPCRRPPRHSQPATSHALARLRRLFNDPLLAASFDPPRSERTFVITAPEFGELTLVPTLVRRLRADAPHVRVEVHAPDPERAFDMLESGAIDLRIAWLTAAAPSLRAIQLFEYRLVVIAHDRHPKLRDRLTFDQFVTLPHARTLGTSHATTIRVVDEAVSRLGRKLERSFLVQHFLTIPATLVGTDLIATLPLTQARAFAAQHPLKVHEPPLRLPKIRYGAYWHERSQKEEGHRWLRRVILDAARAAYPEARTARSRESAAERVRA